MPIRRCLTLLVTAAGLLVACGAPAQPDAAALQATVEAQVRATVEAQQAAQAAQPTATAAATPPPQPTATTAPTPPPQPTASPTPAPSPTEKPTVQPTPTKEPTAEPTPTEEPTPAIAAEVGGSRSNPLARDAEVRFDTWAVRSVEVVRGADAQAAIAETNQFNESPREGYEYVLVTTTVENISTEQAAENPSYGVDFRLTGDRNILYNRSSVVVPEPLEGDLFPEGEATGQTAFEVPTDERNLLLFVNESASFDSPPRFIALEDGARVDVSPDLAQIQPSTSGAQRSQPAPRGETVTTANWQATVLEVARGDAALQLAQESNQFNEPAPEGMEYVAVKLRVRNIGTAEPDEAEQVYGNSAFRITGEKNVVYENVSVVPPEPALDAYLFPGGETEGWTVLSVARDEQQLALIFEPSFSFDNDEVRFLALE